MVQCKYIIFIAVIGLAIIFSGCTGQDTLTSSTSYFTPDEIKKALENNPTIQINATYWSENDVIKNIKEINQQCDKPMLAMPMYMATVNVTEETITLWINTSDKKLLCKTNKPLNIKLNDVDIGLSLQHVFVSLDEKYYNDDVYIFHEGWREIELNKTDLIICAEGSCFIFCPISRDNHTFKKGDVLAVKGVDLLLNDNKINGMSLNFESCVDGLSDWHSNASAYAVFLSSNGEAIAKATFPETQKLYIEISKNSLSFSTGGVLLTLPIFRIEVKIIDYNIGGESTDAFGHKYNLLNLTFENNKNVSLLVNLSDLEKLKTVAKLEVNKTYKISYFADSHKLINITEEY